MASVKKTIKKNCEYLGNSQKHLKDVFDVVFSCPDAIMTEDSAYVGKKRYMTYGQIKKEAEKIAGGIYSVTKSSGKYIGLYADNKPLWFALFWGILMSGNYPYLINLRQPFSFSSEILKLLGSDTIVYLDQQPDTDIKCLSYEELTADAESVCSDMPFGDYFAISTSGTTLQKKVCIYSGKEVVSQIMNAEPIMRENSDLVIGKTGYKPPKQLVFLPLYHIFGLEAVFLWYSMWQSVFVFPPDMSPDHLLHTVRDCGVTHIYAVPLFWESIEKSVKKQINKDDNLKKKFEKGLRMSISLQKVFPKAGKLFAKYIFSDVRKLLFGDSVRFCISGGSYIKKETLIFVNGLGYSLANGYGMSELGITSVELSRNVKNRLNASIGHPIGTVCYEINSDNHLCVRGESVCKKIIIDGKEAISGDLFDTGDLMSSDKKGRFYISGRSSDIVFGADGENLNPDFAEQMFSVTAAKHFVVMGDEQNQSLILIAEIPEDIPEEQKSVLKEELEHGNNLLPPSYKIRHIYYTNDPIIGKNGIKVSRAFVKKGLAEGKIRLFENINDKPVYNLSYSDESQLKKELRVLFADVLNTEESDISDTGHFINDLGGSSLDYFSLLSRIDEIYGVMLDFEPENFNYSLNDFERILSERLG